MLTPREYVVKKSVLTKFGSGFFEWINGGEEITIDEDYFALVA